MRFLYHLFLTAFALLLAAYLLPGITVSGLYTALVAALVLGLLNLLVKPILFVLTLPITILTLGLFTFVINASLFWFAASFIDGFSVDSFFTAFLGSLLVTIVSSVSSRLIG